MIADDTLTIALAQMTPVLGDLSANIDRHLDIIRGARDKGANIVIFPELSLTGYFIKDLVPDIAIDLSYSLIQPIVDASRDIDIVVGCVLESEDASFYNAALYLSQGAVMHIHKKVYLPTYGLFDEQRYFSAGREFKTFSLFPKNVASGHSWKAGILICEDMWHPSSASNLASQGVDLFICLSASPARGVGRDEALGSEKSYEAMTRTYAQLFTSYLVYCNRVGYEDGVAYWGGSRVVDSDGQLVGDAAGRDNDLLLREIKWGAVRRSRLAFPLLRDERSAVLGHGNNF